MSIWKEEIYRFDPSTEAPLILDCGANVGLATLFWKYLFPQSRVIAFEPDPLLFAALTDNCAGFSDVELINAAVWDRDGFSDFWFEGSTAGRLEANLVSEHKDGRGKVGTIRLKDHLDRDIDLLKLDIEGAEVAVLRDCQDDLQRVNRIFVEYHSFAGVAQELHELLAILYRSGFRYRLSPEGRSRRGFDDPFLRHGMDNQINIFAERP